MGSMYTQLKEAQGNSGYMCYRWQRVEAGGVTKEIRINIYKIKVVQEFIGVMHDINFKGGVYAYIILSLDIFV